MAPVDPVRDDDFRTCDLFPLLDTLDQVQTWIKDTDLRYRRVSRGFLLNYSLRDESHAIGRTDHDLSPAHLADQYHRDDRLVLAGTSIIDRIELVGRYDHSAGWNLTSKIPLRDPRGRIIGTAGITRSLPDAGEVDFPVRAMGRVMRLIREHYHRDLGNEELAAAMGVSVRAFERRFQRHFHLSPQQYLRRVRVTEACRALLQGNAPLVEIALACGFYDQSHFGREFRRLMGESPARYRRRYDPGA